MEYALVQSLWVVQRIDGLIKLDITYPFLVRVLLPIGFTGPRSGFHWSHRTRFQLPIGRTGPGPSFPLVPQYQDPTSHWSHRTRVRFPIGLRTRVQLPIGPVGPGSNFPLVPQDQGQVSYWTQDQPESSFPLDP